MLIEKPKLFENLRRWREKNNLTSPEWEMYAQANGKHMFVACIISILVGVGYTAIVLR